VTSKVPTKARVALIPPSVTAFTNVLDRAFFICAMISASRWPRLFAHSRTSSSHSAMSLQDLNLEAEPTWAAERLRRRRERRGVSEELVNKAGRFCARSRSRKTRVSPVVAEVRCLLSGGVSRPLVRSL
jgi:hypothetical protein